MTFHILIMVVGHSCEQEKKWKFWFSLKIWKFFKFSKKIKIVIFSPAHSYALRPWDIKSYFLTSGKPKKQKKVKIMHIASLKWRSKMTKNCIFLIFFPQANSQNWHKRLQNANFCYVTKKNKKFGNFRTVLVPLPFS